MNVDKCYKALLSLAEEFRTKSPPDLKACMQCLYAILNLPVSAQITAKTNYHIGSMIYKYTYDTNIAQTYLERAYEQSQTLELTLNRLQVVAPLVDIYLSQNQRQLAKQFLSRAINDTTTSGGGFYNLYWHYRYLLKLSRLNLEDKDFATAINLLSIGAQTAGATNDSTTKVLFLLSKCLVLMIASKYANSNVTNQQPQMQLTNLEQQLTETSTTAGNLIENLQADPTKKESMRLFLLVLQVCRLLNKGHNKTAKPCLKSLQQTMHNLTSSGGPDLVRSDDANMSENFTWMSKDHMFLLVYLISVIYSMQAGFLDKAQNYTERALVQVENLRSQTHESDILLESFHIILLEHMSMCYLVMGNRASAIKQVVHAIQLCFGSNSKLNPNLRIRHRGIIHTLLGFYSMSMSMIEEAENHFNCVIESSDIGEEFSFMARVNLALCWLQQDNDRRNQKRDRIEALLKKVVEDESKINPSSYCQQAAFNYVLGLKAFCDESFTQAKKNLRETLKIANGEDLNRITSCSLVLLGKIFNNSNSPQSSLNMVSPALKLAGRIPDLHLQLWAASMLREIYSENQESPHYIDAANMHANINTLLDNDKMVCMNLPEHYNYVQWDLAPQ